ncbi:MAG: LysR family transcriptional regulator [Intestinibacter sp.]|uniref:LysR family transcriptional regulator n=1 Tax=Intestinibacter sp. TaxID=1965304 RepID=UPI003F145231
MEIRNLVAFLQVAATQNFTQSAQILGYSQSNISMQIQNLESEIGVPLFDRVGHRISLTQYGEELLPYAQHIVSTAIKIQNFKRTEESLGGTLKVGIVESLFETTFKETIEKYHMRFPKVNIDLTVDGTSELQEALKKGKIDVACLIDEPLIKSEWNCLYSHPAKILIVSNSNEPLAMKEEVSIYDISDKDFILMEDTAPYILRFQHCAASYDIEVNPFLKLQSTSMARELVKTGPYLAVLPIYTVSEYIDKGELSIVNIPEFNVVQQVQVVIYKNKVLTPQISGFVEEMKDVLESILKK